mgnify:CR=1 FL=1
MKKLLALFLALALLSAPAAAVETVYDDAIAIAAPSAILVEKTTGAVLYEKNADERLYPASLTKVMTVLLAVEDIESGKIALSDPVTAQPGFDFLP